MPISVPTAAEFDALTARVAKIESGGIIPPQPNPAPAPAAAVGYNTRTLGPDVMIGGNWRRFNFYGNAPVGQHVMQQGAGVVCAGGANGFNAHLCTCESTPTGWRGMAFGGGAYIEATLSWSGDYLGWGMPDSNGWPAFWSNAIEMMGDSVQPGMELDFVEYWGNARWGVAMHTWYSGTQLGQGTDQLPGDGHGIHKYGCLWVPATATTDGYVHVFLDRVHLPTADQSWPLHVPRGVPINQSVIDVQHLALILGSGSANPMAVSSVEVWQKSGAGNLVRA